VLVALLPKNLGFVPPTVLPLVDYTPWQPLTGVPKASHGAKKTTGKAKRGIKRKPNDTVAFSQTQTQINSQAFGFTFVLKKNYFD